VLQDAGAYAIRPDPADSWTLAERLDLPFPGEGTQRTPPGDDGEEPAVPSWIVRVSG
jgi:hypothetical protein